MSRRCSPAALSLPRPHRPPERQDLVLIAGTGQNARAVHPHLPFSPGARPALERIAWFRQGPLYPEATRCAVCKPRGSDPTWKQLAPGNAGTDTPLDLLLPLGGKPSGAVVYERRIGTLAAFAVGSVVDPSVLAD